MDKNSEPLLEMDKINIEITDTSILQRPFTPKVRSFNFQQAKTAVRLNSPNAIFEEIKAKWEAYIYLTQILQMVDNRSIEDFIAFFESQNWNMVKIYNQNITNDPEDWKLKGHFYNLWKNYKSLNPDATLHQFMKTLKNDA